MAIEHDLVVITDEVYEHLVFDDHEHVPIATLPGMAERTLTLSSAGKSYSFTGWKVGWATGPRRPGRRRARRQAVADLHLRRRRSSRPSRTPSTSSRTSRPRSPATCRRAATCCATGLAGGRGSTCIVPEGPTSPPPTCAPSAGTTAWRSAWRCPSAPGGRDPEPGLPRRPARARPAPGPLGVLQGARAVSRRDRRAWPAPTSAPDAPGGQRAGRQSGLRVPRRAVPRGATSRPAGEQQHDHRDRREQRDRRDAPVIEPAG